ncbi:MAG TPA: adenylate/guanylate cyclase domain-containing protein, partial [Candidatus Nanopelagicaceae bacterium]|nr:adenylate/guanylate cyclase domain-containing protein [Candidatus Nanopelagicaceae bacterium]
MTESPDAGRGALSGARVKTGDTGLEAALLPYVPQIALDWVAAGTEELVRVLDGTLAFVDISGFTRLTELLAAQGKAGAEELTGFLDSTFATLLEIAYSNSGQLVKWGGDAVLVWFDGAHHAERAVEAAWRMQRAMRRLGQLRTSRGAVTLRMSVGIHSGSFLFFLVGHRHLELLVTGPGATATARMEALAEAGEIVVSPALADQLTLSVLGPRKRDGFLIASAPRVSRSPESRLAKPAGARAGRCLAAELSTHLLASPVESEHRQVAVAFLEFKGVDG